MAELDDISGILNMLSGGGENGGDGVDIDPELLLKLLEIVSKLGGDDKNMELLKALRPLLREENRQKLDRAAGLMKLFSLLPLLRESGLADGIFKF